MGDCMSGGVKREGLSVGLGRRESHVGNPWVL